MQYLTALELADWLDSQPNQFALMARRLKALGVPFTQVKGCCPKVLRTYHDQRLHGEAPPVEASNAPSFTPNRAALQAFQNRRHVRKQKTV